MNKHHPYKNIIERKLEHLPAADTDLLWNDMHSILDKKMPQKKERRRFILWLLSTNGLLLLTIGLVIITGSLFFFSAKESSVVTIKKLPSSQQSNKIIEDGLAKVSQESNENITTATEADQKTSNNISVTTASTTSVDQVITNNSIKKQTVKQSKKYTITDQFKQQIGASEKYTSKGRSNQPIQNMSTVNANSDIAPINLESIHHFPIEADVNEEKISLSPQLEPATNKVKLNARNNTEKGFYAGIMVGVDMSSVHFQSAKSGATTGFIIGYTLNQKWSIESGLLWDTKRVYDNGSYFNPPGYTPTNGVTIIAVHGKSRLYELPVNIKYTIIPGKHNLFVTTGISSYLMRSENYDYEYTQNNQPGGHNFLSYTKETKNWFSVANFSIGYTHKLGAMGSIRVEPYLKLPLANLGTANMPIMSTGLNIGFTKPLRR
jgi:hypothetical protein